MRTILTWPSRVLSEKAVPVTDFSDPLFKELIRDMLALVRSDEHAAGLAANQVGALVQVFVVSAKVAHQGLALAGDHHVGTADMVFVNPALTDISPNTEVEAEGCLSLPGQVINVRRPRALRVQAQDEHGDRFVLDVAGFFARCVQHEYDHLQGITLFNKASFAQKERIRRAFRPR